MAVESAPSSSPGRFRIEGLLVFGEGIEKALSGSSLFFVHTENSMKDVTFDWEEAKGPANQPLPEVKLQTR